MQVADRLFGAHTAHLAGLFWALSIPLLWLPTIFWDTSLSTLFVIRMLALALRAVERPDQRPLAAHRGLWRTGHAGESVVAAGNVRHLRVGRPPEPLRSSFGYELWQGNRPGADGAFDDSLYPLHNKLEYAEYLSKGEVAYMREKSRLARPTSAPTQANLCGSQPCAWRASGSELEER